jgi:hypothetical protein
MRLIQYVSSAFVLERIMNALILCLGVTGILAVILGFIALLRYLNYRETIAMAEKGLTRPAAKNNKPLLHWGIVITSLGLVLSIGLYFLGFAAYENYPLHLGPWILGGLVPLFLGLGLILLHYLIEKE